VSRIAEDLLHSAFMHSSVGVRTEVAMLRPNGYARSHGRLDPVSLTVPSSYRQRACHVVFAAGYPPNSRAAAESLSMRSFHSLSISHAVHEAGARAHPSMLRLRRLDLGKSGGQATEPLTSVGLYVLLDNTKIHTPAGYGPE